MQQQQDRLWPRRRLALLQGIVVMYVLPSLRYGALVEDAGTDQQRTTSSATDTTKRDQDD